MSSILSQQQEKATNTGIEQIAHLPHLNYFSSPVKWGKYSLFTIPGLSEIQKQVTFASVPAVTFSLYCLPASLHVSFAYSAFFFLLYPLEPGWGFSTEGARGALLSNCSEQGVPTAWVTRATFLSLASENIVSSVSQILTSGKFPGSPRRLTCSWFCAAQQLLCRCEHSCSPFHMACCCSLARVPAPAAAVWPGDQLLTVLHFNNWAVAASCVCYYLEFYSLLAKLISPIPCCS